MNRLQKIAPKRLEKIILVFFSGLFLAFCLYVYQAYNIQSGSSTSGHGLLFRAISFGILTSICFYIHEFLILPQFPNSTTIIFRIWELWFGGTMTFLLFNFFWNWEEWFWKAYFQILLEYTGVIIIPIIISFFAKQYLKNAQQLIKTQQQIKETSSLIPALITFVGSNKKQQLTLPTNDFLLAVSADNYIEIFYLGNQSLEKTLLRCTLKELEKQFQNFPFQRCHRSFFININQIKLVKKSGQKVELVLHHIERSIPISKKYQEYFKSYFQ